MKRFQVTIAFFSLFAGSQVLAEDSGFYVGAGVGSAKEEFTGFSDTAAAFKLLAGYSISQFLSAEVEYVDGGTQRDSANGVEAEISNDGVVGALLARWPVNDYFAPYVKAGYAFYDTSITVTNGTSTFAESRSDSDAMVGGGLEFSLGKSFRLRAEFEKINVPQAAFEIYSVAAIYRF